MKLISKTLQYYLLISLPLVLLASLFSYFLIKNELRDGTDESLLKEKLDAEHLIKSFQEPHHFVLSSDSLSSITISPDFKNNNDIFSDTVIFDANEKELIPYRLIQSDYTYNNIHYKITILKTTIEEDELMEGLLSAFALIISFLMIAFFTANWLLAKTLWLPFYKTLNELNEYEITNYEQQHFPKEKTLEFNQLNEALNKMTKKIHTDFKQQKEFIENASHEMQTPVAVIKANVSLLMQSTNLKEEELNSLLTIENSAKKLAALNKALLLLSKIENNQFKEHEKINIKQITEKNLGNFSDQIQLKKIKLITKYISEPSININPTLADILIVNLIQNAIRHNVKGGEIHITTTDHSIEITNSGASLSIDASELFLRFKKNDASKDSLGLGLAIVKSIITLYNFDIFYNYKNGLHTFAIVF